MGGDEVGRGRERGSGRWSSGAVSGTGRRRRRKKPQRREERGRGQKQHAEATRTPACPIISVTRGNVPFRAVTRLRHVPQPASPHLGGGTSSVEAHLPPNLPPRLSAAESPQQSGLARPRGSQQAAEPSREIARGRGEEGAMAHFVAQSVPAQLFEARGGERSGGGGGEQPVSKL